MTTRDKGGMDNFKLIPLLALTACFGGGTAPTATVGPPGASPDTGAQRSATGAAEVSEVSGVLVLDAPGVCATGPKGGAGCKSNNDCSPGWVCTANPETSCMQPWVDEVAECDAPGQSCRQASHCARACDFDLYGESGCPPAYICDGGICQICASDLDCGAGLYCGALARSVCSDDADCGVQEFCSLG